MIVDYCQYLIVYLSYSLVVKKLHVYMLIDDACIYERICINCTVTISTFIWSCSLFGSMENKVKLTN